ncbi:MAG TPA: ABC transporter permease [Vicinamibacterales bacterium]|nr:ABC transporter permease [Vicinamibacterales bacterium]
MAFLQDVLQDLRYGVRTLARAPGFAAVAILTLALGVGANAAMFSVVNAVLLRPLPWSQPDRAVMIWSRWVSFDKTWVAEGEVIDYRRRNRTMTEVAAWSDGQVNLTGGGVEPERVAAGTVTANTFSTFGVSPIRGRVFTSAEDVPNGPNVAVIGYGLWQRRFAGDESIVGRSIQINGAPYTVLGVMPPDFVLPTDFENPSPSVLWTPLQLDPSSTDHGSHGYYAAGRLRDGVSVEQAREDLHRIAQEMIAEGLYPPQMQFDTVVLSLRDEIVGTIRRAVWLLFGAVAFLLLIACANVANLLLARAEARQREIAVRAALGAGRARVLRQLLTESAVLAGISAALGLALASWGVRLLAWWNPAGIPRVAQAGIDVRVLLFTVGAALLTTIVFSLAPAVRLLKTDLNESMKEGGSNATTGGARQRFRNGLVVAEMALAVVLLIGAGLMLRSLWSLQRIDLGFTPSSVLTMRVALPSASYESAEQVVGFYQRLMERIRQIPGVTEAGAARSLPLGSTIGDFGLNVDGYVPPPGSHAKGDWQIATDGYLEAMDEQIVRGRGLTAHDTSDSQLVAVVNEQMAREYWAGRDAIGGRFRIGMNPSRPWVTVVGIVRNVRHNGVAGEVKEKFYVPHTQWHKSVGNPIRAMTLVVRDGGNPSALTAPIRDAIRQLDPNLPVADVRTMDDVVGASLSAPRFTSLLLGMFAALALTLSAVGIYGVLSYVVSRRAREIGIRMAVGADAPRVLRMVLGSGLLLSGIGLIIGLAAAVPAAGLMRGLLHGITPLDPATFATVAVVLTAVALGASAVPAWRATRVDPVIALKAE